MDDVKSLKPPPTQYFNNTNENDELHRLYYNAILRVVHDIPNIARSLFF